MIYYFKVSKMQLRNKVSAGLFEAGSTVQEFASLKRRNIFFHQCGWNNLFNIKKHVLVFPWDKRELLRFYKFLALWWATFKVLKMKVINLKFLR